MSSHRILITGASGYLGGTLLARWNEANLPPTYDKLFALVRTDAQAAAVKQQYGAEPLALDVSDEKAVRDAVVEHEISIVYFLIDAMRHEAQVHFIRALAEVRERTGREVHFLHTTGAKIFSSHAGAPTDRPLLDTDPDLFSIQKAQKARFPLMQSAVDTNCKIIEESEKYGVRSYIFAPCIVYGKGEGFGNITSIQTVAVVKAARAMRRVYKVDEGEPWPVCHILDNTSLYLDILRTILTGGDPGHGREGFFLASSGPVPWDDIYTAVAAALARRNIVADDSVVPASPEILGRMGEALDCPAEVVSLHIGGKCTFKSERGKRIGWKTQFGPRHIIEAADDEVQLILDNLG
ncbi:hypothetical protein M406DRAFT_41483 [Cryphonectria parasitica EP155]|uniref:NAD-dependent epimerase/dehydratase domain-containing protein n=1 Tax=Cryphonectria parasitica (strain ATCC 38755 / EP155) TaxID=660469 RepID=A0A9P5CQV3_CRYP1|nr:uncharacterized protein M406DRAFT_41483 [Cryphonectria parasitica EP155]KAF3767914.1 hypothetical protein M406DRAFT_41483 [Cryphonectria parasitica EP155]